MIRVEHCMFKDAGFVVNSEIKTQEFPLTVDEINPFILEKGKDAYIARISGRVIGHVIATFDKEKATCTINSIGVDTKFRKVGVARKMLSKIVTDSVIEGCDKIIMRVVSYLVEDKLDPWNIEQWLWRMEFKAIGTCGPTRRYGKDYDYYVFERKLK